MSLKTIEQCKVEMTREEFDKYTEREELCPSSFGLVDGNCNDDDCDVCWNNALTGVQFKENQVILFEARGLELLKALKESEETYKKLSEQRDGLKLELLKTMEQHGIEKWENEDFSISYVRGGTSSTVDSTKLKKQYPEIFEDCIKTSHRKSSIRFKVK